MKVELIFSVSKIKEGLCEECRIKLREKQLCALYKDKVLLSERSSHVRRKRHMELTINPDNI